MAALLRKPAPVERSLARIIPGPAPWTAAGRTRDLAEREQGLAVLPREHDNFRAALDWFWQARGFPLEGQAWLERAGHRSGRSVAAPRAVAAARHGAVLLRRPG